MSATAGYPVEGEVIGPYRVGRRIGGGGMGAVFEALDVALDRRVALKVIAPELAHDAQFRARFTAEARTLASVDSPHVVSVFAHGQQAGHLYIATQLMPDGDLAHLIEERGSLPLRVGLDLIGQVAAGLADTHAMGMVHRDIKPANILLGRHPDGRTAYLCDFGVSDGLGGDAGGVDGTVGTPIWMAPEVHSGGRGGVAGDVYSLGCVLWATLAGRAPYAGATVDQIAAAHREHPVPQLTGDHPMVREVNRILRRAMAKDPARRHRSATELRDDLRRAASMPDVRVRPVAVRGLASCLAALMVLASIAGAIWGPGGEEARETPAGARSRAVASLTRALADQGVMSRAEADCTARRWIAQTGLRPMVEAGFFDADLTYVDQDRSAMTARIESAATSAARGCAVDP
ncbi:MAG: serine/threonine-protein kinase [Nocardioides sp.]